MKKLRKNTTKPKKDKKKLSPEQKARRKKTVRRVSISTAGLAFSIVAVILLNLICTNLTDRFDLTLDLTADHLYEITEDSQEMLKNMEDEVSITVLMSEDDFKDNSYYSTVYTLMQKYLNLAGDKLSIDYIDPNTNPNIVEQYSDLSSSVQSGSVIVECGDNTRVLNVTDFYTTEDDSYYGYTYITGFQGEQALTSAITSVMSDETPAVYILQGHNESVSTTFTEMLTTAGFTVDTVNLTEEQEIPDDASILVISLPQTDYTEDEVDLIDAFIKDGGDLMVFDGTDSPTDLPVLYSYLQEWGAAIESNMVLDAEYNISDATDIFAQLSDSSVNDALSSKSDMVLVTPDAKSITAELDSDVSDRTIETLMESRSTSYAKVLSDDTEYDSYDKSDDDEDGPFAIATLSEYTGNDSGGQVFVCSAALMMADDLMEASSLLNQSFLSNVISTLQPDIDVVTIAAKSLDAEPLTIGTTAMFLVFLILALIPIGIFIRGAVVFVRRRRL